MESADTSLVSRNQEEWKEEKDKLMVGVETPDASLVRRNQCRGDS